MQCDLDVHTAKEGPILRSNTDVTLVFSHHLRTTMLHLCNGQQRECSKRNFPSHFQNGSNLSNNTGLQKRQQLNCAVSAGTGSAATLGDGLGSAAQTFPLQDQCSSVPESKQQGSSPVLRTLLKENRPHFKCITSSSEGTNANLGLNTRTNFSDERRCKSLDISSSLAALTCGQTRTQSLGHSGGPHSTPHQQVSAPFLSCQLVTGKVSTLEVEPYTDDQIQDYIEEKLVHYRTKNRHYGHTHSKGCTFCTNARDFTRKASSVARLPSASDKEDVERHHLNCAVIEQCTAAVGQALEEDCSKGSKANAELSLKSKDTGDCTTSASEKHSTGPLVSTVGNSTPAPKNEFVEMSASAGFDLPVNKHLDVTMPANYNGKLVYSEYPQIMMKVAATCATTEEESPVVFTAVSKRVTLDTLAEKHPGFTLSCSSSQEEKRPLRLNLNKNLDDTDMLGVSWDLKGMSEKEKGDAGLKPVEAQGLDNVQGVTCVSEGLQTKSSSVALENRTFEFASLLQSNILNIKMKDQQLCSVPCEDEIAPFKLNSSIDQIQIHNIVSLLTNHSKGLCNQSRREGVREDAGSVSSQTDLSIALSDKVKEQTPLPESKGEEAGSVNILDDPFCEDISDDEDMSQLARKTQTTAHEELSLPAFFNDQKYEDISEDENPQIENMSVERPLLTRVPKRNNMQSPFDITGYGYVQAQLQMKTEMISDEEVTPKKQEAQTLDIAQHCSCPWSVETDDDYFEGVCPKCDAKRHLGWPTNRSVSWTPSSVLGDETDDQMDDDEIIIPVSISDLKFEPEDEDQDGPVLLDDDETGDKERPYATSPTHYELHLPAPKPASASSEMHVFDTLEGFLKWNAGKYKMDSGGECHTPQKRRESCSEPDDSSETEDSFDYSSGSEHNFLTVSRQLLKRSEADAGSNHVQHKGQKISTKDAIIILDSDTEDEGGQPCTKKANRKRLFSSGSEDRGDAPCSQQTRHSPETVDSQGGTADSTAPQHQSKVPDRQDACSHLSCSTEKSGLLSEARAGSEHVQKRTNRQKTSKKQSVIILDSDTEDDDDRNYKKTANRKRIFSSGSVDGSDAPCLQQKRHLPEIVDHEYGTAKEKHQETRLPSADSSLPQHQSKVPDRQDACSHLSCSTEKSGQWTEARAGSEHVQKRTNRRKTSKNESVINLDSDTEDDNDRNYKKTANRKRIFSSGSVDGSDAPCLQQKRPLPEIVDCETKRPMTSKRMFHDSDKVVKGNFSKNKATRKNMFSSEDSGDSFFASQNKPSEAMDSLCGAANEKPEKVTHSSEDFLEKQPLSLDKEADYTLSPNPLIPRLVVQTSSQSSDCLTLSKESRVYSEDKGETRAPKTPTAARRKTDSCEMDMGDLHRTTKGRFVSKPKPAAQNKVQANLTKPRLVSRPSQEGPSTSIRSLSSTIENLFEARRRSASSRGLSPSGEASTSSIPPKSKQSTSIPRQHLSSSKLQRSHSYSNTSTLDQPYTPRKSPSSSATMQSSARKQVIDDWQRSFYPTRRDRKSSLEEDLRTTNHNSVREGRPGSSHYDKAPRQRHNSHECATLLMKKTKLDAKQWTKAISRDAPREQRYAVGEGYKWSEKPTVVKQTKGSGRHFRKSISPPCPGL